MTDLLKQMAEALRKSYEALMLSRPGSENNDATEEEWQAHFAARRLARDTIAKFDAQAAEQAAGGERALVEHVPGTLILAVDAAMVEAANLHPPLTRSDCKRVILAAMQALRWSPAHPAPAPVQPVGELTAEQRDAQEAPFEAWWEQHGQFHRAGGGAYEKTFAWHAWCAAISTRPALSDAEIDALRRDAERYRWLRDGGKRRRIRRR